MFCIKCGEKLERGDKFCKNCGKPTSSETEIKTSQTELGQKWWLRLAKVAYISLYIILPFFLIIVWNENSYYPEDAFWITLITFVIYIVSARLIKITFLYIVFAQKPIWKKEFKKFF